MPEEIDLLKLVCQRLEDAGIAYMLNRNTEFQRRKQVDLDGIPIWIVSLEDLIISKLFWAKDSLSELQLRDVKNLLSSIKTIGKKYISNWIHKLGLDSIYAKATN